MTSQTSKQTEKTLPLTAFQQALAEARSQMTVVTQAGERWVRKHAQLSQPKK
jgi:hypothetical protein